MQLNLKKFLLLFGLIIYCFAFQGARGLTDPDEGRYSAVALNMLERHDWIHPHINREQEHWNKPPFTYWMVASSIIALGKTEFAVRFPIALAYFLIIFICYGLGEIYSVKNRFLAPIVFATFFFPAVMNNILTTDYLLTFWETLAVYGFSAALWGKKQHQNKFIFLMWLAFGMAFLTKGPAGFLPLLSIIIFLNIRKQDMKNFSLRWLPGLIITLVIGLSWYIVVVIEKKGLAHYFIWHELITRVGAHGHGRNKHWYMVFAVYLPVLLLGTFPWTLAILNGFKRQANEAKGFLGKNITTFTAQSLFLVLWIIIQLIVFGLVVKSKLPLYILPVFIPLAIIAARQLESKEETFRPPYKTLALWCTLLLMFRFAGAYIPLQNNTLSFYQKLKKITAKPYTEIIFVAAEPLLGLKFYTGLDVMFLNLEPDVLQKRNSESNHGLWILEENNEEKFKNALGGDKDAFCRLGNIEGDPRLVVFWDKSTSQPCGI